MIHECHQSDESNFECTRGTMEPEASFRGAGGRRPQGKRKKKKERKKEKREKKRKKDKKKEGNYE